MIKAKEEGKDMESNTTMCVDYWGADDRDNLSKRQEKVKQEIENFMPMPYNMVDADTLYQLKKERVSRLKSSNEIQKRLLMLNLMR